MSGLIHFSSGKTLEITEKEFLAIPPKLKNGGVRLVQTARGDFIPLNSNTMEYIEHIVEPEEEVEKPIKPVKMTIGEPVQVELTMPKKKVEKPKLSPEGLAGDEPITDLSEERMDTIREIPKKTQEDVMADMVAKSNCLHEPEKLELYIQHTAKGIRYFPVCSFCGKRERYVSESKINKGEYAGTVNEKWTDEDIAHAKEWVEN